MPDGALENLEYEAPAEPETPPVDTPPESVAEAVATEPPAPDASLAAPSDSVATPEAEPFAFQVDGKPLSFDGVVKRGDKIEIPLSVYDQEIAKKYLANRETWGQKEGGYRRKLAEIDSQLKAKDQEVAKARLDSTAAMKWWTDTVELAKTDPVKFAEQLDAWIARAPAAVAEAKLAILQERETQTLEAQRREQQEQEEAQADRELAEFLDQQIRTALSSDYKDLAPKPEYADKVVAEVIKAYGDEILAKLPTSQAWEFGVQGWQVLGQVGDWVVGFSRERLLAALDSRKQVLGLSRQQWEEGEKAKARNAAVLKPTPPPIPVPQKPRNESGQFAKPDDKPKGRRLLEELTME